jgi:hypothetical protein
MIVQKLPSALKTVAETGFARTVDVTAGPRSVESIAMEPTPAPTDAQNVVSA